MADPTEATQGPAPAENRYELVITAEAEVVRADDRADDEGGE